MGLWDLPAGTLFLLGLPALVNIWSIWHASRHSFPGEKEQLFWILGGVFFPVAGGIAYLLFGLRRAR